MTSPTRHYSLTKKQLAILNLLYRFRFATSELISKSTNTNIRIINQRLKLMLDIGYIGRNYEPEYRLLRKHASYYLLPDGMKALKQQDAAKYNATVLRNIAKDKNASSTFITHCLATFGMYCNLRAQHGDNIQFFTASQLKSYKNFPAKLPDAFIRLKTAQGESMFFLDVLHESQPFFVATRRIMHYIKYAEDGDWPNGAPFPIVLLACDSPSLQKRLQKRMQRIISEQEDESLRFFISTTNTTQQTTWQNMADPDEELTLHEIL